MERKRESVALTYPHDLYRRFKPDEYKSLDERFAKIDEVCEDRLKASRKGIYELTKKKGNIVEVQLLEHNLELEKLQRKGNALITNIRVACEQRQLEERKTEKRFEEGILEHMQKNSVDIEEKLSKIHDRWAKLQSRRNDEPSKFLKTLKILKSQILELMNAKDNIIETIRNDLVRINASNYSVLVKQDYDLHYLMQRVNNYLTTLKQCYKRQILKLDETINQFHQGEYERLYKCRHEFSNEIILGQDISCMLEDIDKKQVAECEYRATLQMKFRELRTEYDEVTHSFRIHMEKEQENMEMELEETTATYFLNSLKFNYNYQVLETKNAEKANQIAYEGEKKNLLKLGNSATDLKKEMKDAKDSFKTKTLEIEDYCKKMRDRLTKSVVKAKNAIRDNESKFQSILKMNLDEANALLSQICALNKIFFEEHLGIRWELPDLNTLMDSNLKSLQTSNDIEKAVGTDKQKEETAHNSNELANWKMIQRAFETISGSMDYLMDEDLPDVFELCNLTPEEKRLVQLANVFSAVGLEHPDGLTKLFKNLELFAHCSQCEDEKVIEIHSKDDKTISTVESPSRCRDSAESSFVPNVERNADTVSLDLDIMRCIEDLNQQSNSDQRCLDSNHEFSVNYAYILSALEITVKSVGTEKLGEGEEEKINAISDMFIDPQQRKEQIERLWTSYQTMFPDEHVHVWSSLEHGLADYLVQLKKRQKLHMECDRLRRQNAQLKYMLQEVRDKN